MRTAIHRRSEPQLLTNQDANLSYKGILSSRLLDFEPKRGAARLEPARPVPRRRGPFFRKSRKAKCTDSVRPAAARWRVVVFARRRPNGSDEFASSRSPVALPDHVHRASWRGGAPLPREQHRSSGRTIARARERPHSATSFSEQSLLQGI